MKRVDYDGYRREKAPERLRDRLALLNAFPGRQPRQRPRDPAEDVLLGRLIRARFRRLRASGELVRVGPRRWLWRLCCFRRASAPTGNRCAAWRVQGCV